MPRKAKASTVAAKAFQTAVDEQTRELRADLERAQRRIQTLERKLRGISQTALGAIGEAETAVSTPATPLPRFEEPLLPDGPSVDLNPGDNMGSGRWV